MGDKGAYDDGRYGTKQVLSLRETGALNGTDASATEVAACRMTVMQPVTVKDFNAFCIAGGTNATRSITLGKSAAGTGAISAIGTISVGTSATGAVLDGSVTETNLSAGDDLVITTIGTSTTVENLSPNVMVVEHFDNTGA